MNQNYKFSEHKWKLILDVDDVTNKIKTDVFVEKNITNLDESNNDNLIQYIQYENKTYEKVKVDSFEDLKLYVTDSAIFRCKFKIAYIPDEGKFGLSPKLSTIYVSNTNNVNDKCSLDKLSDETKVDDDCISITI